MSELPVGGATFIRVSADQKLIAFSTESGHLIVVSAESRRILVDQSLCQGAMNGLDFIAARSSIAYGCQDGAAGIWDLQNSSHVNLGRIEGGVNAVVAYYREPYVLFGGNNGKILVYDLAAGWVHFYLGHTARISTFVVPSDTFPYLASGDNDGDVRVWPIPQTSLRMVFQSPVRLLGSLQISNTDRVLAMTLTQTLRWVSLSGQTGELTKHDPNHFMIGMAKSSGNFALLGEDSTVELWSSADLRTHRVVKTDHSAVSYVAYLDDGASFITGGRDGRVVFWSADASQHIEIGHIPGVVEQMIPVPGTHTVIVRDARGVLWRLTDGHADALTSDSQEVTRYRLSADSRWLAAGTQQGTLDFFDVNTWQPVRQAKFTRPIADIRFSAVDNALAVLLPDSVHLISNVDSPWRQIEVGKGLISLSSDGKWFAFASNRGTIWFYSFEHRRWICDTIDTDKILSAAFTSDGNYLVVSDANGRVWLAKISALRVK